MYTNREILLVDDEPTVLHTLTRELRPYFPHLHVAQNGQEALELLARHPIQMVISDYRMPGMNGADLVIEIYRLYPQVISLILSGNPDINGLARALNEGKLYKFLLKPWERNYLLETIFQCFGEKERREAFDSISGMKTQHALNKQVSLLQSLADHPYLVLMMEWQTPLDHLQRKAISQHFSELLEETESVYQEGSRWFWVTHRQTAWYQKLFKLIASFKMAAISDSATFDATAAPHWWIADVHSWPNSEPLSANLSIQSIPLVDDLPIYWRGNPNEADEIKQLLTIYHDLLRHHFCAFYQPQQRLHSGEVLAFEALARRSIGEDKYQTPEHFFPILDQYHLIVELTEIMLRDILQMLTTPAFVAQHITIGVNIPGKMLTDGSFYRLLANIAEMTQAKHVLHRLEVEITEHDLIADFSAAKHELDKLKLLGIRCALDDFGTGYSSYEYLCEIPFDAVKIDGRYIQSLGKSDSSTVILHSMISSIKSLSMQVIAESVDSEQQYQILQEMGCDMVQGFLISPAISSEQVLMYLNQE